MIKRVILLLPCMVLMVMGVSAQESAKDAMLKKKAEFTNRTMVQRFDKTLIPTAQERQFKRQKNEERRKTLLFMIDTSQIKEKYKEKLRFDVMHKPFSPRLHKFLEKRKEANLSSNQIVQQF